MDITIRSLDQKIFPELRERGKQISQDEFMRRWGSCHWPNQDVNKLDPDSGYFVHGGNLMRYSGVRDYYRPALWWEWLIVCTWGRVFWFNGKRWRTVIVDYRCWTPFRSFHTRLGAWISSCLWVLRQHPRGTFELSGRGVVLYDEMLGKAHRSFMPGEESNR